MRPPWKPKIAKRQGTHCAIGGNRGTAAYRQAAPAIEEATKPLEEVDNPQEQSGFNFVHPKCIGLDPHLCSRQKNEVRFRFFLLGSAVCFKGGLPVLLMVFC